MSALSDTTKQLCEMAEWFKEQGDMETYLSAKVTATKLLDFILYTSSPPNSEARRNKMSIKPYTTKYQPCEWVVYQPKEGRNEMSALL